MSDMKLYVEKGTDLMRSSLIAYGLASVFHELNADEIWISDLGMAYQLRVGVSLELVKDKIRRGGLPQVLPAITKPPSASEKKRLEAGEPQEEIERRYLPIDYAGRKIDYGNEKQKSEARWKAKKAREEGEIPERHPDFPLWAHLCSYFGKGSAMRTGYPLLIHTWWAHHKQHDEALFDLIMSLYGDLPNQVEDAAAYWIDEIKPHLEYPDFELFNWSQSNLSDITALSIVSPTTAQGSFATTSAKSLNNNSLDIFWLELYLAFAGYMAVGMPFKAGGDVLLYYPQPKRIEFWSLRRILDEYRNSSDVVRLYDYSNKMPRIKIDLLSQISFFRKMVDHYWLNHPDAGDIDAITGLVGYYYKDISTQIPFDETTFILPPWLPLQPSEAALEDAEMILDEQAKIVRALRGDHAEELVILDDLRRFTTLGDPNDFLQFAIAYGEHRFAKLVDQPWLPFLTFSTLENVLMNNDIRDYRP
ncbi:MAG: hypothetical protein GYB68_19130, partial [Chloroflexi bacterium]|nr:hypothetical protein [Chloroflexota bacterium]